MDADVVNQTGLASSKARGGTGRLAGLNIRCRLHAAMGMALACNADMHYYMPTMKTNATGDKRKYRLCTEAKQWPNKRKSPGCVSPKG